MVVSPPSNENLFDPHTWYAGIFQTLLPGSVSPEFFSSYSAEAVPAFLLHFIRQPIYLFLIADVFKLNAYMCGITFFKVGQYVSEGCGSKANQITGMKFLIEIRFRKPKEGQLNIGPLSFRVRIDWSLPADVLCYDNQGLNDMPSTPHPPDIYRVNINTNRFLQTGKTGAAPTLLPFPLATTLLKAKSNPSKTSASQGQHFPGCSQNPCKGFR